MKAVTVNGTQYRSMSEAIRAALMNPENAEKKGVEIAKEVGCHPVQVCLVKKALLAAEFGALDFRLRDGTLVA